MMDSKVRIPHLEDLIFEGIDEIGNMLSILDNIVEPNKLNITTKWDGAPAIICGRHPETNRFFVSTKSFWNIDSKVNYTTEDIKRNHESPGLQGKLALCLTYLPELNIKGILQGDMMYDASNLYIKDKNVCFKPNIIEYRYPINSPIGQRILESQIGIVFHTSYGPLMEANYKVDIGSLNLLSKNVWFRDASIIQSEFNSIEKGTILDYMNDAYCHLQRCSQSVLNKFHINEALKTLTKKYINDIVRQGKQNYLGAPALHNFIINKMSDSIDEAVKPETKINRKAKLDEMNKWLTKNSYNLDCMCKAYNIVLDAKNLIMSKLEDNTVTEGFVVSMPGTVVKLIDRSKFSYENFNNGKDWK